jgi:hypothetical protein
MSLLARYFRPTPRHFREGGNLEKITGSRPSQKKGKQLH